MMLGGVCQYFYVIADGIIVGRLIGVEAFAAVGATALLTWTLLSVVIGLTQGFGILFAQRFGAKDECELRKAFGLAIALCACFGVALTAAGLLLAKPLLIALNTPSDILSDASVYLYIIFSGTPLAIAYNLAGTLLRSMGNSKTPLYAALISSALNILLDVLFIAVFRMGVAGAAAAGLIAQLLSLVYCLYALKGIRAARPGIGDCRSGGKTVKTLLRYALPLALRNGVISAGGLAVQYAINGYGTLFIAGMSAAEQFFGAMGIVGGGMECALATFTAQNFGAGLMVRVRAGVRAATRISLVSAVIISAIVLLLGRQMLALFFAGDANIYELLSFGYAHLTAMAIALPALYMLYVYRSAISGAGNTTVPMFSGFVELGMRVLAVFTLPIFIAEWGVYIAESVGWVGAFIFLMVTYKFTFRR
jgi:putative MATE family efflux protein